MNADALQNRVGGRKVAGGFDSLPPPPSCLVNLDTVVACKVKL